MVIQLRTCMMMRMTFSERNPMGRHAYLVLAHNKMNQLEVLLKVLDHELNDIFVLLDCKTQGVDLDALRRSVSMGRLFMLPDKIDVQWGQYSQVKAKMILLRAAIESGHHDFYHQVSGVDLPLKGQNYIHSFFDSHSEYEFLSYSPGSRSFKYAHRNRYYYGFLRSVGRPKSRFQKIRIFFVAAVQGLLLGVDRCKEYPEITFVKGGAWYSITDTFARYCVEHESLIEKIFSETYCGDESLMQTMLFNSPYWDRLYVPDEKMGERCGMRLTDWTRGNPYTWQDGDFEELISSPLLFARKFDIDANRGIVGRIAAHALEMDGRRFAGIL